MGKHTPKFKNRFDRATARAVIEHLVQKHDISITKRSESKTGYAHIGSKSVQIPYATTVENFMVCLHEIGHILYGGSNQMYYAEYKAERYALRMGSKCGLSEEDMARYKSRARRYILTRIHKGFKHGLRMDRLRPEVLDFIGYDFSKWPGNYVIIKQSVGKMYISLIDKEGNKTQETFEPR